MTLAELVEQEACRFDSWGNQAGDLLARQMRRLAGDIRFTNSRTPKEFEARAEVAWEGWYEPGTLEAV